MLLEVMGSRNYSQFRKSQRILKSVFEVVALTAAMSDITTSDFCVKFNNVQYFNLALFAENHV